MKRGKIRTSFAIITALGIIITSLTVLIVSYVNLAGLVDISVQDHVTDFMDTFGITIGGLLTDSQINAENLSNYDDLISALNEKDHEKIHSSVEYFINFTSIKTDNITITDEKGVVLCRYYMPGEIGDDITSIESVRKAINGETSTGVATGSVIRLGASTTMPVKNAEGKIIGTVMITYSLEDTSIVDTIKGNEYTELTIFIGDERLNTTIINNGERAVGTKMDSKIAKIVLEDKKDYHGEANIFGTAYRTMYHPLEDVNGDIVGALFAGTKIEHIESEKKTAIAMCIAISVIVSIIMIFIIVVYTAKSIAAPIVNLCNDANEMAKGNLNIEVHKGPNNEIGMLAEAFKSTVTNLRGYIKDISENLDAMASKDMTREIQRDYIGDFAAIKSSMQQISTSFNETLSSINLAAEQVNSGSEHVATGSQSLSQGATEQASSIEELAASINIISDKINTNAKHAQDATNMTNVAGSEMKQVNDKMDQLVNAMEEIRTSSAQTNNIIKTIEDIAFQTNILALNAAVEAARAGSVGKGFAVVADEVRNLAGKSAEAAKNTTDLIKQTVSAIEKGSVYVGEVAEKLVSVSESSRQVVEINHKISDDSKDAADSIAQITVGVDQISSVVQTNSATAQESAAASEELSGQANMLKNEISQFKLKNY